MAKRKGIVLEVHDKWAIILNEKGQYKKIKTPRPVHIGELWQESSNPGWRIAVAAVITLVFLGGCIDFFSVVAYAEVSSGIKIGVNRWDRVVLVEPSNPQTSEYVNKVNFKGRKIDEVVEQVVKETISEKSKLSVAARPVLTVTTTKKDEVNRQRLVKILNKKIQPIIIKQTKTNRGSIEPSRKNSLPAVENKDTKPETNIRVENKAGNTVVTPRVMRKNVIANPAANVNKAKDSKIPEVRPLQSENKLPIRQKDIKAGQETKVEEADQKYSPGIRANDAESLPEAVNKDNNQGKDAPKPVVQSEKPKQGDTSPEVNINKQNNVPEPGEHGNKNKSNSN